MWCLGGPQPNPRDLSHCERCLGRAVRETCGFAGGMRGWSNKKSYIHLLFGPVDGTSRKQGLESLVNKEAGLAHGHRRVQATYSAACHNFWFI